MSNGARRNEKFRFQPFTLPKLASGMKILCLFMSCWTLKCHPAVIIFDMTYSHDDKFYRTADYSGSRQTVKLQPSGLALPLLLLIFQHDELFISRTKLAITA